MFVVYEMRRSCEDLPESQIKCIPFDEKYLRQYKMLYNFAFRPMREALDIKPYDWYDDDRAILSKAHGIYLLTDGDELIGSVSLKDNEIDDLFVSDSFSREGYGRKILIWAMNQLVLQGADEFILHVAEWNSSAVKLYLDEGFEITKKDQIGIEMVSYDSSYKQRVFEFTDRCFTELGKKFDPDGRHGFYNDIENEFVVFYCVTDHGNVVGTVGLKKIDEYKRSIPYHNKDRIIFLGFRNDVEEIIKVSTLTVLFTNYHIHGEGISNSILESMAIGVPVVATQGGGTPEIIDHGKNGYMVKNNDINQSVHFIDTIITNSILRQNMSQHCLETVREHFDLEKTTNQYINLYKSLLTNI